MVLVDLTATLSNTGALVRQTARAFSGTLTEAGALIKQTMWPTPLGRLWAIVLEWRALPLATESRVVAMDHEAHAVGIAQYSRVVAIEADHRTAPME